MALRKNREQKPVIPEENEIALPSTWLQTGSVLALTNRMVAYRPPEPKANTEIFDLVAKTLVPSLDHEFNMLIALSCGRRFVAANQRVIRIYSRLNYLRKTPQIIPLSYDKELKLSPRLAAIKETPDGKHLVLLINLFKKNKIVANEIFVVNLETQVVGKKIAAKNVVDVIAFSATRLGLVPANANTYDRPFLIFCDYTNDAWICTNGKFGSNIMSPNCNVAAVCALPNKPYLMTVALDQPLVTLWQMSDGNVLNSVKTRVLGVKGQVHELHLVGDATFFYQAQHIERMLTVCGNEFVEREISTLTNVIQRIYFPDQWSIGYFDIKNGNPVLKICTYSNLQNEHQKKHEEEVLLHLVPALDPIPAGVCRVVASYCPARFYKFAPTNQSSDFVDDTPGQFKRKNYGWNCT